MKQYASRLLLASLLSLPLFAGIAGYETTFDRSAIGQVQGPVAGAAPSPAEEVVELVNIERLNNGNLPPLKHQAILDSSSQTHSDNMASRDFFMHCDPDTGTSPTQRMVAAGYTGWAANAENIAAGYATAEAMMAALMGSSGHRSVILSTNYNELGVGYAYQANDQPTVRLSADGLCPATSFNNGPYAHYWTQNFGRRHDVYPLVIAREAFAVPAIQVELYVYGPSTATQMRFSNDGATWSDWQPYATDIGWRLAPGDGVKQVYSQVSAGASTYEAADTVVVDAAPPLAPAVEIEDGAAVELRWQHATANLWYDVHRSETAPYFNPGGADSAQIGTQVPPPPGGGDVMFTDSGSLAGHTYYYQVLATGGDGVTQAQANRVGRFVFTLAPGG